ncbi:MAG: hypothetical protein O3A00_11530, partial [Planctomycetota bacterium]|nr:hypothetical protein [Planctomycetota bacterium]
FEPPDPSQPLHETCAKEFVSQEPVFNTLSEVYEQQLILGSVWPDGQLAGLDLLMRVVRDIDAVQADSDALDPKRLSQATFIKSEAATAGLERGLNS